jgi:hypothetical protein
MRDIVERKNLIWLWRNKEQPKGTAASGTNSAALLCDSGSGLEVTFDRRTNESELCGSDAPTTCYDLGVRSRGKLQQSKARPDFLIWGLGAFLGAATSTSVGTTAYQHTLTPQTDSPDHPSFTVCQRIGNDASGVGVLKRRYAGCLVSSFSLDLSKDWCAFEVELQGSGNYENNYDYETVTAAENTTSITLAAAAVAGTDNDARVANVVLVRTKAGDGTVYSSLSPTTVSDATPAVVNFAEAAGTGSGDIDYEVFYYPDETSKSYFTPPSFDSETPLRLVDAEIYFDGYFDGDSFTGGDAVSCALSGAMLGGSNELAVEQCAGSGVDYATSSLRLSRKIELQLRRRLTDPVRQRIAESGSEFAMLLRLRGAEIDSGSGVYFGADIILPRCVYVENSPKVENELNVESGKIVALEHTTQGLIKVFGYNTVASYI